MDDSKSGGAGPSDDKLAGVGGGGQSGGGAYPNPHAGKEGGKDGFMGSGGQTEMPYHGTGRLGDRKTGANANAPAAGTAETEDKEKGEGPKE